MCNATTLFQLICLCCFVVQVTQGFSVNVQQSKSSNSTRTRRQVQRKTCERTEFQCASGDCIDGDKECDGSVDCKDASDETNACTRIRCPQYLFRCKYGACINPKMECDGKPDCRDASDESSPKCKVDDASPNCTDIQFRCSSGQCIPEDNKCDGRAECKDNSDEIAATCWNMRCPGYAYRCKYGACVKGNAECDGIVDCFDGSDESPEVCGNKSETTPTPSPVTVSPKPTPQTFEGGCILPEHPEAGSWTLWGVPGKFEPGQEAPPGAILRIQCKPQHKLQGNNGIFCENGEWSSKIGRCATLCSNLKSDKKVEVFCNYHTNNVTKDCIDPVDGTLAKFQCAPFYEDSNLSKQQVTVCKDGSWNMRTPDCTPVCGEKSVSVHTLIVNGKPVNRGEYPWQVALYNYTSKELLCGGSLLNQRVILTAAHCVTNEKGKPFSTEEYIVAVGKYYRLFNDSRDANDAQFSQLEEIAIPPQYRGEIQHYQGDIAILVTKKTFVLSNRVQAVCVDWGMNYNTVNNEFGYVTGWGFTLENDKPSDVLKEVKIPAVAKDVCERAIPQDFEKYLTYDKMCAGFLDNGTSVCSGDSGGGLVFKYGGRYYITGIVSLSPSSKHSSTGGCDSQQYGVFTQVSRYINDFIILKESLYRP